MSISTSPTDAGSGSRSTISATTAVIVACVALFTDMLTYGLAIPALPLLPATAAAGPAATGLMFASYAAAMICLTPVAGRLVDRRGPRTPLLVGLIGLALATLLFALGGPFWLLVLARILQGAAAAMSWVASLSLIAAVTPFATRGRSLGLAMSMVSLGILIGPPLSGFLIEHVGITAPFILAAGLALADGAARIILVRDSPRVTDDPAGPLSVLRVRGSRAVIGAVVCGAAAIAAIEPVFPRHVVGQLGTGPTGVGILFGAAVLTGAVVNPIAGSLMGRIDARVLVAIGVFTCAAGLLGLALGVELWHFAAAMAVLGIGSAFVLAPATTVIGWQGARAEPPALGAAYALFNLAYAGGLMVGPVIAGALADKWGFGTAMVGVATMIMVVGAISSLNLPKGLDHGSVAPTSASGDSS